MRVLSLSLARTRGLVHLAQPALQADGELKMYASYAQHLKAQLEALLCVAPDAGPSTSHELSTAEPGPAAPARYIPSRWLLLSCYEAALSAEDSGFIRQSGVERVTVALFLLLTADKFLLPVNTHAAADCRMLYEEAVGIHRRVGQQRSLTPGSALTRWVLGRPRASALRCATHPINPLQPASLSTALGSNAAKRPLARPQPPFGSSATRAWLSVKEIEGLTFFGGHPEGYGAPPPAVPVGGESVSATT